MSEVAAAIAEIHAAINADVAAEIFADVCDVQTLDAGAWVTAFADAPCSVKFSRAPFPLTGKFEDAYIIKLPMQASDGTPIVVNEGARIRVAERDANDPELVFEVITNKRRKTVFTELICRQVATGVGDGSGDLLGMTATNALCVVLAATAGTDARFRPTKTYAARTVYDLPCYFAPVDASERDVEGRTQAKGDYTATLPASYEGAAVEVADHDRVTVRAQEVDGVETRPAMTLEVVGILYQDGQYIRLDLAKLGA